MQSEIASYGLLAALAIATLYAGWSDVRGRRIANWLTLTIAVTAPLFWLVAGLSPWPQIAAQIGTALLTFFVGAFLFKIRAVGGGDVKLFAALALWLEPGWFFNLVLLAAVLHGVISIVVYTQYRRAKLAGRKPAKQGVPYAVSIAIAVIGVLAVRYGPAAEAAFSHNAMLS